MPQVEVRVLELMALMEPSYLQVRADWAEAMRRLLFAAGVAVAEASGGVSTEERAALEKLLGPGSIPRELESERLEADLPRRISRVRDLVPPARRVQLVRDLTLIARADGRLDEAERAVIDGLAVALDVDPAIVGSAMSAPTGIGFGP